MQQNPDTTMQAEFRGVTASPGLRRFAWFVLGYNVLVVLWGAVVRATGSGAGCGAHWPLCNGVVIPQAPAFHTIVEFTHRLMSGATLLLVTALWVWTRSTMLKGTRARWWAVASTLLTFNEALLGALLVLLRLVAHNQSSARGIYLAFHFTNTLLLLASLTLTAEFISRPQTVAQRFSFRAWLVPLCGLGATLLVGVSGSLAALGDTLYPATSFAAALQQDFSATSSLLLRLRWLHPASAILAGMYIVWLVAHNLLRPVPSTHRQLSIALLSCLLAQYCLGTLDVFLLAPLWIQVLHLLLADLLWIFLILLTVRSVPMIRSLESGDAPLSSI